MATYLQAKFGFVRLSFAHKLKDFADQILLFPLNKRVMKHRRFLQGFGETVRQVDPMCWVRWLGFDIAKYEDLNANIVIDDCRYKNEASYLKSHDFILIRLTGRDRSLGAKAKDHPSETEQDQIECEFEIDMSQHITKCFDELERIIKKRGEDNNIGLYVAFEHDKASL